MKNEDKAAKDTGVQQAADRERKAVKRDGFKAYERKAFQLMR